MVPHDTRQVGYSLVGTGKFNLLFLWLIGGVRFRVWVDFQGLHVACSAKLLLQALRGFKAPGWV